MTGELDWGPLIAAAHAVRERSYSPYSRFAVGAAVATESGAIHAGCNVENRSFGLTLCAERVAVSAAVAAGSGPPVAVAVVTDADPPAPPCGLCRETLAEFAGPDLPVLLLSTAGERRLTTLGELFPEPFVFPPG
ncbi:MAG: cytidine deaminase [Thermoanaerobaculia bacterium]|nr:cytidine deaminase [Thermoanaerobaculia bacterium]